VPLISYAQNFEDVILWRALKRIERGFYIDIGAQDPVVDSVSLAFYERGWRGVHVEPTTLYAENLRRMRPDEEVIQAAVDNRVKSRVFYEIPGTGLSTGSRVNAERHKTQGHQIQKVRVPCLPLSAILDRHRDRDIHWLKIDVEGMERQVIQSWRPSRVRPWIVVVESTEPLSLRPGFARWEPLLIGLGYEFAYFDGLNRFYVSHRHPELRESFGAGPNVFDDFVLSGFASAPQHQQLAERAKETVNALASRDQQTATLNSEIAHLRAEVSHAEGCEAELQQQLAAHQSNAQAAMAREHELGALKEQLATVYRSTSWRITALPRFVSGVVRWLVKGIWAWITLKPGSRPRRVAKRILAPPLQLLTRLSKILDISHQANSVAMPDEPEGVRRLYQRLAQARMYVADGR